MDIYTEIGIDFDNNKYGLGVSSEIEKEGQDEIRKKGFHKMKIIGIYSRLWLFKTVFIISSKNGFEIKRKNRNNFKWVLGLRGK
ncbi:MAG: DUF3977 family protein [Alphaproteobacteria bacterium]|jgi:hypothetical protein|nr:DUF3977 family protein [Alphaproteobacteria bacterium]MCV6598994.1 DUF3977 family protein [Alphaproteobacteria bacterium]